VELCLARRSAHVQPRHVHDSLIVGVVTAGTRRIDTSAGRTLVHAGGIFILPPGLAHACAPENGPSTYLAVSMQAEALPPGLLPMRLPLRLADADLGRALLRLAEACETSASALERQSLLACALERLCACAAAAGDGEEAERTEKRLLAAAVLQARELLAAEPERDIGLPELAETCGAEMYALHRAFTRAVGLPPHAFQTHQRLRRAKALLRAGASLTDAALAAGFCDQSHMHRHFTRLVGFTPAQYASAHMARRAR
jgi:methylphosphotriester-DNA--protein-cysteine methyltransferase